MLSSETAPRDAECGPGAITPQAMSEADDVVVVTSHGDSSLAIPSAPALAVHLSVWGTLYSVGATCLLFAIILLVAGLPPTYISTNGGRRRYVAVMIPILAVAATVLHFFMLEYPLRMLNAFLYDTTVEADRHRAVVEAATAHARDAEQRRALALNEENNHNGVVAGIDIEREISWMNKQLQYLERLHRMPLHPLLHTEHKTLHNFLASLIAVQRAHLIALKRQSAAEVPYMMGGSSSVMRRHSTLRFGSERHLPSSLSPTPSLARAVPGGVTPAISATVVVEPKHNGLMTALAGKAKGHASAAPSASSPPAVIVGDVDDSRLSKGGVHGVGKPGAGSLAAAAAKPGKTLHGGMRLDSAPLVESVDVATPTRRTAAATTSSHHRHHHYGSGGGEGRTSNDAETRDGEAMSQQPLQPTTSNVHDETALLHTATDLSDEDDISGTYGFSYSTKRSLTLLDPLLSTLHQNERNMSLTTSPSRRAGMPSPRSIPPSPANVEVNVTPHVTPFAAADKHGAPDVHAAKKTANNNGTTTTTAATAAAITSNNNNNNSSSSGRAVVKGGEAARGGSAEVEKGNADTGPQAGRAAHVDPTTALSRPRRPLLSPDGIPTIDLHRGDRFAGDTANTFFYVVVTPDAVRDSSVFDSAASHGVRVFAFEANVVAGTGSTDPRNDGAAVAVPWQRFAVLPDTAAAASHSTATSLHPDHESALEKTRKTNRRPYRLTVGGVQSEPRPASEAERLLVDFLRCVVEERAASERNNDATGTTTPDLTSLAVPHAAQGIEDTKSAATSTHAMNGEADLFSEIDLVKLKQHLHVQPLRDAESYILSWAVLPNRPMRLTFLAVNLHESVANEQLGRRTTVCRRTVPVIECMVADVYCVLTSARVMTNEAGDEVHSLELNGICIESRSLSQSDSDSFSARSGASDRSMHIGKVVTERRVRKV